MERIGVQDTGVKRTSAKGKRERHDRQTRSLLDETDKQRRLIRGGRGDVI